MPMHGDKRRKLESIHDQAILLRLN
jgi:hypothetical protein